MEKGDFWNVPPAPFHRCPQPQPGPDTLQLWEEVTRIFAAVIPGGCPKQTPAHIAVPFSVIISAIYSVSAACQVFYSYLLIFTRILLRRHYFSFKERTMTLREALAGPGLIRKQVMELVLPRSDSQDQGLLQDCTIR